MKGVGKKVKGIGSSTSTTGASHANFAPWSSFAGPIHAELAVAWAESAAGRVETQQYQ